VALLRRAFAGAELLPADVPLAPPLPEDPPAPEAPPVADPAQPWCRAEGVGLRLIGAGAFLWWPGDGMLWQLNPVARAVWALLEIPGSVRDLAEALAEVFPDTGRARLEADCAALIGQLAEEGFVRAA
jgi:hypothetical protein